MTLLDQNANPIPSQAPDIVDDRQRAEAQDKSEQLSKALRLQRKVLKADEIIAMQHLQTRLEQHFPNLNAWFFTIDGVLEGKPVRGALFAGECMLVFATTERQARRLAADGLTATLDLMREEYANRSPLVAGINGPDVGGRRLRGPSTVDTPQMKKLARLMRSIVGGEPWRG